MTAPTADALRDLLARVRGASGEDRWLDAEICAALRVVPDFDDSIYILPLKIDVERDWDGPRIRVFTEREGGKEWREASRRAPFLTASVDACIALAERVLPGMNRIIGKGRTRPDEPLYGAQILDGEKPIGEGESEHSEALALLASILSALLASPRLDPPGLVGP